MYIAKLCTIYVSISSLYAEFHHLHKTNNHRPLSSDWWYAWLALFGLIGVGLIITSALGSSYLKDKRKRRQHTKLIQKYTRVFVFDPSKSDTPQQSSSTAPPVMSPSESEESTNTSSSSSFMISSVENNVVAGFNNLLSRADTAASGSRKTKKLGLQKNSNNNNNEHALESTKKETLFYKVWNRLINIGQNLPLDAVKNYQQTCSICLDDFVSGDIIRELKCKHCFHRSCVDMYLYGQIAGDRPNPREECPICSRHVLGPDTTTATTATAETEVVVEMEQA
jgi:hypothetical protein